MLDPREQPTLRKEVLPKMFRASSNAKSFGVKLTVGLCECKKRNKLQLLAEKSNAALLYCHSNRCSNKIIKIRFGE